MTSNLSFGLIAAPAPRRASGLLSPRAEWLFFGFGFMITVPVLDLPFWELSLSAPIFCLLVIELLPRGMMQALGAVRVWTLWAAMFWIGIYISFAGNVLIGKNTSVRVADIQILLRYAFWLLTFITTALLVATTTLGRRTVTLFACGIITLGALRIAEGLYLGNWGKEMPKLLTQNGYGIQFSMFAIYAALFVVASRGAVRFGAGAGTCVLLCAVVSNLSRSSWIAIAAAVLVSAICLAVAARKANMLILLPIALLAGAMIWPYLPGVVTEPIERRFSTFSTLERDKSLAVRLFMNQKGQELFLRNPVLGVGPGRFRLSSVEMNLPPILRYARLAYFDSKSPHNSYVALLAELGLAGMLPFGLLVLALTVGGAWAAVHHTRRGEFWALAAYCGFIAMSIHFWTIMAITNTAPWVLYGIAAGMIQREFLYRRRAGVVRDGSTGV